MRTDRNCQTRFHARRTLVYVEDLPTALRFYRDVLGFTATVGLEGVNQEFETGGTPLVLHAGGVASAEPRGLSGVVPSFAVSDIQGVMADIKQRGVRTVVDLREVLHGWIYFFADPEGNVVQLYQPKHEGQVG